MFNRFTVSFSVAALLISAVTARASELKLTDDARQIGAAIQAVASAESESARYRITSVYRQGDTSLLVEITSEQGSCQALLVHLQSRSDNSGDYDAHLDSYRMLRFCRH